MSITPPTADFATASGLTIPNVLSMAIVGLFSPSTHETRDGLSQLGGRRRDRDARFFQGGDLLGRRSLAAADDRARVAHALAGRRGLAGDERRDRLLHVRL